MTNGYERRRDNEAGRFGPAGRRVLGEPRHRTGRYRDRGDDSAIGRLLDGMTDAAEERAAAAERRRSG